MKSIPLVLLTLLGAALLTVNTAIAEDAPLKLANTNITDVLAEYGRLIGKTVVADPTVQGRVSVVTEKPVSREQAAALIEKTLFLNDLALFDAGDDTVGVLGLGRLSRNYALPLYVKPEEIPNAQRVFSYLVKLQHRNPTLVVGLLAQIMPPTNVIGYTADAPSKTLIITAPTYIVRRALGIIANLDVPGVEDKPLAAQNPPDSSESKPRPLESVPDRKPVEDKPRPPQRQPGMN